MTDLRMASWMAERKRRAERARISGWTILIAVFLVGFATYLHRTDDPLQYIRDQCLSHHGGPVDDKDADGRVLAIRCDLLRRLP